VWLAADDPWAIETSDVGAERLVFYLVLMSGTAAALTFVEHAAHNAMDDSDEIERFHGRCSDFMRELLVVLAAAPDHPRAFPEIEDELAWPRRRIASVLGGVWHLRTTDAVRAASDDGRP
jgi:hypothetical protein